MQRLTGHISITALTVWICALGLSPVVAQQFPSTGLGARPQGLSSPAMVPIPRPGVAPPGQAGFDPYSTATTGGVFPPFAGQPRLGGVFPAAIPQPSQFQTFPQPGYPGAAGGLGGGLPSTAPASGSIGGYPGYSGAPPAVPGVGQSGIVGTFPNAGPNYSQPGVFPNAPSALFPGTNYASPYGQRSGGLFSWLFGNKGPRFALPAAPYSNGQSQGGAPGVFPPGTAWNPQGSVFAGGTSYPRFIRFFQGPRFRHAYVAGNNDADALAINDSDLALAFTWPNFLFSTQPLYIMPSFSLHQWDGPDTPAGADLPAIAYSAFIDSGWQSDPGRILGAELGVRVGMFTDFDTATSDSLRVMGRGIGRMRLTPRATLKAGVLYLGRDKIKILPAGGLLWQPNPDTRFDLFFPEPKLAHYLSTVGTHDTWWYVGGYYGGGSWTIQRRDGSDDSIDLNDLRLVLGMEWGRNDQMREGRRSGFFEVGYVFDRELRYEKSPLDNLDLQDTIMVRAGIGF